MLRDAEMVMGQITRHPDVVYTVLVPNLRGAERALDVNADELNLVMSTSETHNRANLRMARDDSFAALREVIRFVDGRRPITVSLSTCFGCPMEGDVPAATVADWLGDLLTLVFKVSRFVTPPGWPIRRRYSD